MVGVATAKTPCGPYTYKGSWKPLGADSRDMGLFLDSEYDYDEFQVCADFILANRMLPSSAISICTAE